MNMLNIENGFLYHKLTLALAYIKTNNKKWESMSIETYNVCNLKCTMCPYPITKREPHKMSMQQFKHTVDDAISFGINNFCLSHYNEPLLDSLLFERIEYIKSKGVRVGFFSNATLLNKDNIEQIITHEVDYINFSVDGYSKKVYEQIRIGADFEIVKQNILNLIARKTTLNKAVPLITIGFTVQKNNIHELKQFQEEWRGLCNVGFWESDNRIEYKRTNKEKTKAYPCGLLCGGGLSVMSNGKIPFCCRDYDGDYLLGDLNHQTVNDVWNSKMLQSYKSLHYNGHGNVIPICKNCDGLYSGFVWWMGVYPLNKIGAKLYSMKLNKKTGNRKGA